MILVKSSLLGYNVMHSNGSQPAFQRNISFTSSGLKSKPNKKPEWIWQQACCASCLLHRGALFAACFIVVASLTYSSALKLEVTCPAEMLLHL
jgi:hypothetical protein